MTVRDLRGLALLAHTLAHELSEDALDLERILARQRYYGSQVADAGVTTLARIACAVSLIPPYDLHSRVDLRAALHGAIESLDRLRDLLKHTEKLTSAAVTVCERMKTRSEELMAVVRALLVECEREYRLRIA